MGIFDFLKSKKNSLNINEFNNNNERVIQVDNGFVFKTIESEDHMNIELDWLDKTVPIYIDNGNTGLRTDTLYTDDSLSVFLNTETTKNANTISSKKLLKEVLLLVAKS
jgi:hypothetical protein